MWVFHCTPSRVIWFLQIGLLLTKEPLVLPNVKDDKNGDRNLDIEELKKIVHDVDGMPQGFSHPLHDIVLSLTFDLTMAAGETTVNTTMVKPIRSDDELRRMYEQAV
eukprot:SAG11_NODE_6671_length_1270_cov_1.459436_3_plen_106_part_01